MPADAIEAAAQRCYDAVLEGYDRRPWHLLRDHERVRWRNGAVAANPSLLAPTTSKTVRIANPTGARP